MNEDDDEKRLQELSAAIRTALLAHVDSLLAACAVSQDPRVASAWGKVIACSELMLRADPKTKLRSIICQFDR